MSTWQGTTPPPEFRISPLGWLLIVLRLPLIGSVVFGGLVVLLALRLIERPLCGTSRPVTPWITVAVCRMTLLVMGLKVEPRGQIGQTGVIVANHTSWLDIFVLNSRIPLYFVAKQEVSRWPGIGWLARATGTLFIRRDPRAAQAGANALQERLLQGQRLLFFPEGSSSDGLRVLPFKTTLFAALMAQPLRKHLKVQALSVTYYAPKGREPQFYGWWGDMDFASGLIHVLGQVRQGHVRVTAHPMLAVADMPDRKALAAQLEKQTRAGFLEAKKHPGKINLPG